MLRRLLACLVLGPPRPCGDDECVAESPEEHGIIPPPQASPGPRFFII